MNQDQIATLTADLWGCDPTSLEIDVMVYPWGSPATAGLWKVRCTLPGEEREAFVKVVRHVRLWPGLTQIPTEELRRQFVETFPWRFEVDMHLAGVGEVLPEGMRTPRLLGLREPDDEHVVLWWERIHERPGAWTMPEYERAAYLLGRFAARRRDGAAVNATLPEVCRSAPNWALRYFVENRVLRGAAPVLRSGELWAHPLLEAAVRRSGDDSLGEDMVRLADRAPRLLDLLDDLPLTYAHGDASPQNLLVDERDPETFVVIDWGFGTLLPVGFDLGQLLVGPVHAGLCDPDRIPEIDALLVAPYTAGMRDEGMDVAEKVVRTGYVVSLALRSALVSLPFEVLGPPDPGHHAPSEATRLLVDQRMRMTRHLLDLASPWMAEHAENASVAEVGIGIGSTS